MKPFLISLILFGFSNAVAQVPGATISGQLRAVDGTPVVGVRIAVAELDPSLGPGAFVVIGRTDNAGRYHLENVPPGQYFVIAGAVDSPTYYPGTDQLSSAKSVNVVKESTIAGLDFRLVTSINAMLVASAPIVRPPLIHGRFVIEGERELQGPYGWFNVKYGNSLLRLGSSVGTFDVPLQSSAEYISVETFSNRLIGNYYIKSMSYGSIDLLKDPLIISGTNPTEILITLKSGKQISGNVRTSTGDPANISVYLIPKDPALNRPDLLRIANSDSQGNFDFYGVAPGDYVLSSANDRDPARESPSVTVTDDLNAIHLQMDLNRGLHNVP